MGNDGVIVIFLLALAAGAISISIFGMVLALRIFGTLIRKIPLENLLPKAKAMVLAGKGWITRNSRCPCNSGKRFKNCCMKGE